MKKNKKLNFFVSIKILFIFKYEIYLIKMVIFTFVYLYQITKLSSYVTIQTKYKSSTK